MTTTTDQGPEAVTPAREHQEPAVAARAKPSRTYSARYKAGGWLSTRAWRRRAREPCCAGKACTAR